jgi:hypothetical protein
MAKEKIFKLLLNYPAFATSGKETKLSQID